MPILSTPRLWLLPLSRAMIRRRLEHGRFDLECAGPDGPLSVHFAPEWPGDPLAFFPAVLARLRPEQQEVGPDTSFTVVSRAAPRAMSGAMHEAIGQIGTTGSVSAAGELEIGYGLNPAARGQGHATEAVGALVAHLLTLTGVRAVTASTALHNRPSERVLEKLGFVRTGLGWSKEDGDLKLWVRRSV